MKRSNFFNMTQKNNKPADVFETFLVARRGGDLETVKSTLSADTLMTIGNVSQAEAISFDQALNSVGRFYGQHHGERLPKTQNEIISKDVACVEVENFSFGGFDRFIFLKEKDAWKLAPEMEVIDVIEDKAIFGKLFNCLRTIFSNLFGSVKTKS